MVLASMPAAPQVMVNEGTNISVDVSGDKRLATDLLGSIWVLPARGGSAEPVTDTASPASRPRWSPDDSRILFQSDAAHGAELKLLEVASGNIRTLSGAETSDLFGAWHPGGERIVFSSSRHDSGLDLWEMDLPSGLSWRLSSMPGDESEPVWSSSGRHLAFIHSHGDTWALVLRRFGQPEEVLFESEEPLSSLAWRPDGSLLTFYRQHEDQLALYMLILSDPPLVRRMVDGEDFFRFPVSWAGRTGFFYTADGKIKRRDFGSRRVETVHFAAMVGQPSTRSKQAVVQRQLPVLKAPDERLVIRARRLFDGMSPGYREATDVLMENGIIRSVASRREWPDAVILDLGDVSVVPGLVDTYSVLPDRDPEQLGAELLSYGITSLVSDDPGPAFDAALWENEATPGPRLLVASAVSTPPSAESRAVLATLTAADISAAVQKSNVRAWQRLGVPVFAESWDVGLSLGADLLPGARALPRSPLGNRYQDVQIATPGGPIALLSGLADAATPGLAELFNSRQALLFGHSRSVPRRYASLPRLSNGSATVVLGSKLNGLPAGLALHAELRALAAAGLSGEQVLRSAGVNAGRVLGLDAQIGRIGSGALADLVLLAGDPLNNVSDTLNIVAVVRNGRFYSLINLLERAAPHANVE
jgi:hypothetical protein